MTTYLFNAPVATNFGLFRYSRLTSNEVMDLMKGGYVSAIGHEATAKLFSLVTGIEVKANRLQVKMIAGDSAIVFWLNSRQPEGVVITSVGMLEQIGYSFGLLKMLEEEARE